MLRRTGGSVEDCMSDSRYLVLLMLSDRIFLDFGPCILLLFSNPQKRLLPYHSTFVCCCSDFSMEASCVLRQHPAIYLLCLFYHAVEQLLFSLFIYPVLLLVHLFTGSCLTNNNEDV